VGTVLTEGSVALLSAAAVVDTGSLVAGRAHSGAARLKLTQPLLLSGSLALESAGFRDADGKLTTSRVQLSGGLDLAGHELRIFGGYAGSVGFNATPASPRYQFVAGDFTWTQAKADAEAKGGHLATAISKEEWDSISRTLGSAVMSKNLFIGGADPDLSGSWQWTTGEPWSFQNWASGQPDAGSERYVLVYGAESPGVWHNVAGDWPGRVDGYILEIEPPDTNSQSAVVAGAFNLRGPGRLAFEWKESLFDEEGADWDKFLLRVSAGELVLPEEVTLDVAGLGQVNFFASKLTNYGTVRIADQGWLKAYNYERVGTAAMELLGQDAKFDKMDLATGEGDESTWSFAHAVKEDGTLWAWGWNEAANGERGILGTGSSAQYVNEPEQVGADTDWKAVFDGSHSFFAIKTDGTLWAWGNNQYANGSNIGILGVGSLEVVVTKPQQVGVDDKWKTVRVGSNGTTGLKTDGSLWAWGDNSEGRLALPSSIPFADAPVRIGLDGDWKALFGNDALYAVKADGSLWTWGTYHDAYGVNDSGLGEERSRSAGVVPEPTRVGEDNGWQSVSGSFVGGHYAVKTDGTLWAWGHNTAGRLGVGVDVETVTVPTQVGEDRDWRAAFLSGDLAVWGRSFGLKSDGSLWSWGYSNEVSPGDHQHVRVPTLVPSDVPWVGLPHHGADGFIGVKSDGTLWRWEWNAPTCTRVGEDTDWAVLAGGGQPDALFLGRILKTDGSLWRFSGYYNQAGTDWVQDTEPVEIKVSIGWNR
jgi:alpha-tubulin suppressor-like RCC1 family protein